MINLDENIVTLNDIVTKILHKRSQLEQDRSLLVAVSGMDGSGKGYITEKIVAEVNHQGVYAIAINIDPWLALPEIRFNLDSPGEHFYHYGIRFDDMFKMLICPLKENLSINLTTELTGQFGVPSTQIYDLQDVDVILLEGIFLLKRSLRHHYDLSFWIECYFATALKRAIERNQEDLPPELIVHDYNTIYFPAQRLHLAFDEPKSSIDGIYVNET